MDIEKILNLKIEHSDFPKEMTIKGYLKALLKTLWEEGEGFSGKRPFGNSGWEYDLYTPLVKAKVVSGELDDYGCVDDIDIKAANDIIKCAIEYCFGE